MGLLAQSRLGSRLLLDQEDYMFEEMARYVPSKIALFLIRAGVRLRYRHIPDFMPEDRLEEIAGLAARHDRSTHGDFLAGLSPRDVLPLAARHHAGAGTLAHARLLGLCAAAGAATANGHLIIGRNFDFEGPEDLSIVKRPCCSSRPRERIPFASVAWVGMSGVVTGLNTEGIFVSVNARAHRRQGLRKACRCRSSCAR